jgi:hypothetical protein
MAETVQVIEVTILGEIQLFERQQISVFWEYWQ